MVSQFNNEENCFGRIFLKKWHPEPTINHAIGIFTFSSVLFLSFGIVITILNFQITEFTISEYNLLGDCPIQGYNSQCTFTIEVPMMIGNNVYLFYELSNFYQNHRGYVKSKNTNQLSGEVISQKSAELYCNPVIYNSDLFTYQQNYYIDKNNEYILRDKVMQESNIANPCGLIAKSFFNDSYSMQIGQSKINITETGITWPKDIGTKYKSATINESWIDVENEHFIVWEQTSGIKDFRKLWGKIEGGFNKSNITFTIQNNYDTSTYSGSKGLFLSTSGPLGGKNVFLSTTTFIVSFLSLIIAAFFYCQGRNENYNLKQ